MTVARVSQAALEVLRINTDVKARVSQSALEVLRINTANKVRVSQAALEILRANGAETPIVTTGVQPLTIVIAT